MSEQIVNYKCPSCTAPLRFSEDSGKMECDFCGNLYELDEIKEMYAAKEAAASGEPSVDASVEEWGENAEKMRAYNCPSCGARLLCEETTAGGHCPYCGNTTVVPAQFSGALKPDWILPFKIGKKAAEDALKRHYGGKFLLPKVFSSENHIKEIRGVYVPFWLFSGKVNVDMSFHAIKTGSRREGDYRIEETSHYDVVRRGNIMFDKVPVDASVKMPDKLTRSIEPYNYSDLTDFSNLYLAGFMADRYDLPREEAVGKGTSRFYSTAIAKTRETVSGYKRVNVQSKNLSVSDRECHYALLPVWLLSTEWNGKNYLFAMNGQTGKMVGNLPVDEKKAEVLFWSVLISSSAVLAVLLAESIGRVILGFF